MGVAAWGKGPFGSCTLETEGPSGALRLAVAPETNFHNESPFGNMRQAAALETNFHDEGSFRKAATPEAISNLHPQTFMMRALLEPCVRPPDKLSY
jgi:hypothetical protein